MATTSEGWIKKIVKEMLDMHPHAYYHMPVSNGMGAPTLDFICCIHGSYVAIETKAPGKRMTDRQEHTAVEIELSCGKVIRNVGTDWPSVVGLYGRLFEAPCIGTRGWDRWAKWYKNAEGKDANKPIS